MIVTISAVSPFGDYGVGIHTSEPPAFSVCFGAETAISVIRAAVSGPDDRLVVHGEDANPVFVEAVNGLLGQNYEPWKHMPSGLFSRDHLVPA